MSIYTQGNLVKEGPWPVTVSAESLSALSTCDYPLFARAGMGNTFQCYARDQYSNIINYDDFSSAFVMSYYINDQL